jgi:hypothetical protein
MTNKELLVKLEEAATQSRDQFHYYRGGFDALREMTALIIEAEQEEAKQEADEPASET